MNKIFILPLLLVALPGSVFSASFSPPTTCPTVESIRTSTSHVWINKNKPNSYFGFLDQQSFGTDRNWGLIIWDIQALSMGDAERQAKYALQTVSYQYGPQEQSSNTWRCLYKSENGYNVITYTLVQDK